MKVLKYILVIALTAACVMYFLKPEPFKEAVVVPVESIIDKKLEIMSVVVDGFEEKKELITYETELSEIITWDESWGEISAFHKSQKIKFYGTGIYICDLGRVNESNITVDIEKETVSVLIPTPEIKTVTIDDDKTEYEDVAHGWLRFGKIKLTPAQYNAIYSEVKSAMAQKMEDLHPQAKRSAINSVKEIFENILYAAKINYSVKVTTDQ